MKTPFLFLAWLIPGLMSAALSPRDTVHGLQSTEKRRAAVIGCTESILQVATVRPCSLLWTIDRRPSSDSSYVIVFLNKKPDAEKLDKETQTTLFQGHMDNINRLAKENKLLAAGPFDGGGGLFILNTTDTEEAESWIATDPAVRAKRWNIELLPYTPRIGSICPQSETAEMVSYTFVRFSAIIEKFTASNYPTLIRQHDAFVRETVDEADIVTEAIFGPNEGGILIVRSDLPSETFSNDPGVQQGLLTVQVRKLYIARSSFCEK